MTLPSSDLLSLLPRETIRQHRVVPLSLTDGILRVGMDRPPDAVLLGDLAFLSGMSVVSSTLEPNELNALLEAWGAVDTPEAPPRLGDATPSVDAEPPEKTAERFRLDLRGAVVRQVERIIEQAVAHGASDVHVEPYESFFRVRYRLDGMLHTVGTLSLLQREALVSRIKIMAALDIAERRRPQDGRLRYEHAGRVIDLRVSTLPTVFGEKVVLRLLDQGSLHLDLDVLGFDPPALAAFRRAIHQPYGMILVSGPTGSGKTTTLYAALNELNVESVNIITVEDPIEFNLPGVNQTLVRSDINLTFARALRAFLRQDPNVIMVGEIRDAETAEIAVRASLTGHLVLSTIHTNDAPSTITRLTDMGIEPFLVASSLRLIVAQRLVRCVCPACCVEADSEPLLLNELQPDETPIQWRRGLGCPTCNHTGYRGRTALFEVMPVSEQTAELVTRQTPTHGLRRQARAEGWPSLRAAGLARIRDGVTTPDEVLRETSPW